MRCLIVGATGQVGSHLVGGCVDRGLAHLGTWYRHPGRGCEPLDVRDGDAVSELVADYQPDVTFLTARPTTDDPDLAPGECREIIVEGTRRVAEAVARDGGTLVAFSSDEVFGECPTARREDDPLAPKSAFARCKAEAEAVVREVLPDRHLVIRTGWVFGPEERRGNRACQLADRFAAGEVVSAAADRHGQPTYGPDLAEVALELARLGETGTVHVVGPDRHTEFSFARLAAHVLGFDSDLVAARIGSDDLRPAKVWLDRYKLRTLLGPGAVRGAADGLRAMRGTLTTAVARAA